MELLFGKYKKVDMDAEEWIDASGCAHMKYRQETWTSNRGAYWSWYARLPNEYRTVAARIHRKLQREKADIDKIGELDSVELR